MTAPPADSGLYSEHWIHRPPGMRFVDGVWVEVEKGWVPQSSSARFGHRKPRSLAEKRALEEAAKKAEEEARAEDPAEDAEAGEDGAEASGEDTAAD